MHCSALPDDWQPVLLCEGENVLQMLLGVVCSARIGRVVDENGLAVLVDERLHMCQVNFPLLLGEKSIQSILDAEMHRESSIQRKPGARNEQVRAGVTQRLHSLRQMPDRQKG